MASDSLTDSLRETLAVFEEPGVPRTTPEVADQLGLGRRSTYNRLKRLAEQDRLETKKVGANARVWWRPSTNATAKTSNWPAAAGSLIDDVLDRAEVGVFVLDENFEVAWINAATERYFGLDREQVLGRDKRKLVDERITAVVDDSETFAEMVLSTYDDNTYTEHFECHVTSGTGQAERWLEHRSKPIESGAYAGGRVELYYDVTDRKRAERARQEDRRQFESLTEAVEEYAILMLDTDGYVQSWNPGAERIKGYAADEMLGEHFSTFYPEAARAAGVPEQNLSEAAEHGSVEDEGWRVRADGSRFWANVVITAIRDDDGDLQGYAKITRNMTKRREREQELRRERDLTEQLLETAPTRLAVFHADGSIERISSQARRQLGIDESELSEFSIEDLDIYDADGNPIAEANHPVSRVFETGEPVSDWLVQHDGPNGDRRWISFTAAPLSDDDGTVKRVVVAGKDVTELKQKEQQRELERYETIVETVTDGIVVVDADARIQTVNNALIEMTGYPRERLVGAHASLIRPDDLDEEMHDVQASLDAGTDTERVETMIQPANAEPFPSVTHFARITLDDGTAGRIGVIRDISDQVQRERELEESERRYRTLVEHFPNGSVGLFDEDFTYDVVGGELLDEFGFSPDDIIDTRIYGRFPDEIVDRIEPNFRAVFDGESNTFEIDLGDRVLLAQTVPVRDAEDEVDAGMLVVQDITERKQRERELSQYETLFEESKDVNVIAEADGTFQYLTPSAQNVFGYDPEELVGEVGFEFIHPDDREEALTEFAKMIESSGYEPEIEFRFERKDGSWIVLEALARDLRDDPDVEGVVIYTRDVTERKERERALEESEWQYRTLAENFPNGAVILFDEDLQNLIAGGETFEGLDVSTEDLERNTIHEHLPAELLDTFEPRFRAVFEGQASEFEFEFNDQIRQFQIVPVRDESGSVFAGLTLSQDVTDHREYERELERQREQLTALNSLNDIVRDITEAVIDQSTREEIEEIVCDRLAKADSYEFAWIAEVDLQMQSIIPRVEAGVDGYLEKIPLSTDPDEPAGRGPAGRAVRTREVQISQDAFTDSDFEPWWEYAKQYDYRSSAAIPIVHNDIFYGLLGVYADRPKAFNGEEREVVGQLGEVVGHAIAAIERKQALTSDEITEIEFTIPDISELAGLDMGIDGTISFDRAVPTGDGAYLEYGTVDASGIDALEALVDRLDHFEEVTIVDREADTARFKLQLSEPPVVSAVASHGGYLHQAAIENNDFHLTIHLPVTVEARRIIDVVQDTYPTADLLRRRQITRSDDTLTRVNQELAGDLTDRQRATLEAAYHAGFFEWPRDATGEEVAESLGIAPSTFSQHLRRGQQHVFRSLFSTATPA